MATLDSLKGLVSSKLGVARSNQFLVELPTSFQSGGFLAQLSRALNGNDMNLLCSRASLPGRQVTTLDRRIGMEYQKVGYGYVVDPVSMTFYMLNDYGVKKYFDSWYNTILNDDTNVAFYKTQYQKPVKIHQLRKPIVNKQFDIGPINIDIGIGAGTVYSCLLEDAYPVNVSSIELDNELDGLVQLTVEFAYTKWKPVNDTQGFFKVSAGLPGGLGGIF